MPYSHCNISWLSFYRIDGDVSHPFPSHELETFPGSVPSWLSVLVFDGSNSCTNAWIWWRTSEQLKMTSPNSVASWTRSLTLKSHSARTIRFASGWFRSSTSTFGQNTWSNVPPGCEWPPLLPPYCWQRFRMHILCCYTDYMIINIIVYDLIISSIYTRCINMYSIWSYYISKCHERPCCKLSSLYSGWHIDDSATLSFCSTRLRQLMAWGMSLNSHLYRNMLPLKTW